MKKTSIFLCIIQMVLICMIIMNEIIDYCVITKVCSLCYQLSFVVYSVLITIKSIKQQEEQTQSIFRQYGFVIGYVGYLIYFVILAIQ